MRRITGNKGVLPIECVNPKKDKWRIRWNITDKGNDMALWNEYDFNHKPTEQEVKDVIINWHNAQTAERIRSGFRWRGMPVWLSQENQMNYKAAYDLAVQTDGATLPVMFKFGAEQPVYHTFDNLADLTDFYTSAVRHVQDTLETGWREKNEVDYGMYI